jgi:hypothetical protein
MVERELLLGLVAVDVWRVLLASRYRNRVFRLHAISLNLTLCFHQLHRFFIVSWSNVTSLGIVNLEWSSTRAVTRVSGRFSSHACPHPESED